MKYEMYHRSGKKSSKKVNLDDSVFSIEPNSHCVYLAVNSEMAALRQGTHSSKTRSEVSGSGSKPWRQKGTGRARIGSIRNPSRVHGSKAFGPKPHGYSKKVNKKVRHIARRSVLSQKVLDKALIIVDDLHPDTSKTSEFVEILKQLKLVDKKITILIDSMDENLYLGSRNIKNISVMTASSASAYDLIDCQFILMNEASVKILNQQLSK